MCKCCQSLWESCYWHCCEKHFCWDDSIALYEDPDEKKNEQNNNGFDNMAFYDNVALIANRAIFTIEPLPPKEPIVVVTQPKKKLRWFEDESDSEENIYTVDQEKDNKNDQENYNKNNQEIDHIKGQEIEYKNNLENNQEINHKKYQENNHKINQEIDYKNDQEIEDKNNQKINNKNNQDKDDKNEQKENDKIHNNKNEINSRFSTLRRRKMSTVPEEDHDAISIDIIDDEHKNEEIKKEKSPKIKEKSLEINNTSNKIIVPVEINGKMEETTVELRRKKLQERRMSKGLTLMINRPEIPVIRHNSMPKFYLDTPEDNQIYYTGARTPSVTLTAPIKPKSFDFDLKSVVQIQNQNDVNPPLENTKPKRSQSVKERLLKRQSSIQSVNPHQLASIHM